MVIMLEEMPEMHHDSDSKGEMEGFSSVIDVNTAVEEEEG